MKSPPKKVVSFRILYKDVSEIKKLLKKWMLNKKYKTYEKRS